MRVWQRSPGGIDPRAAMSRLRGDFDCGEGVVTYVHHVLPDSGFDSGAGLGYPAPLGTQWSGSLMAPRDGMQPIGKTAAHMGGGRALRLAALLAVGLVASSAMTP